MKRIIIFAIVLFSTNIINGQMETVENLIERVKEEYAPDSRTARFMVEIREESEKYLIDGETNLPQAKNALIEKLKANNIKFEEEIEVLPEKELGNKIYGVINLSAANIRSKPSHSAELTTQAVLGTPIKVLKKESYWYLIQTPDKYIAWVDSEGFHLMTKEEYEQWIDSGKVIYLRDYGFSYSQPDEESIRVSDLIAGNLLKFEGKADNGFIEVSYPDGREAFVEDKFTADFEEWKKLNQETGEKIVETAKKYMGIPYLWGGTSTKGFDCSGYTKTVYRLNGILLPRDASQQVRTGELVTEDTIDFEKLKPGDLLFFGRKGTEKQKERITHVGIYIGDTEFIHASGKVKINSLDKSRPNFNQYRYDSFIRAKRILSSVDENGINTFYTNEFYKGD